jgi:hypothetical protein
VNGSAYLEAVSFAAPGMADWHSAQAVLRGEQAYLACELPVYQPGLLPANERRRASPTVRMAFRVAESATRHAGRPDSLAASQLATVFSSSDGDLAIAQRICVALAEAQRGISPTDFHNSVHNAAAGYWSIASLARGPSTAIAAFDDSFVVGLLEALGMVLVEQQATLLVAYDIPSPVPMHASRPLRDPVGVGLVLTAQRTPNSLASLGVSLGTRTSHGPVTVMQDAVLETLRMGNPAARALPLLAVLAHRQAGRVVLQLPGPNSVAVQINANLDRDT